MDSKNEHREVMRIRYVSAVALVVGVWLIVSPYVLNYEMTASYWNGVITAAIVVVMAVVRLIYTHMNWANWVSGLAGMWLIVSPFFLAYTGAVSYWNQIIFGILLVGLMSYSDVSSTQQRHVHHPAH